MTRCAATNTFTDYSHSSQDSYTTFMLTQKGLKNDGASRASILMKTGACVGGTSKCCRQRYIFESNSC